MAQHLADLTTPALLLDRATLERNCATMAERMTQLGVRLRPHMKTAKSAEVARIATRGHFGGITVSTVAEAEYFTDHGFTDIFYAVGIVPNKLPALKALQDKGARITIVTDNPTMAQGAAERAAALGTQFPVLVEIDTGDGRGGLLPEDPMVVELARLIHDAGGLDFEGVMTHAGQSYGCEDADAVAAIAETERAGITHAAQRLRDAGLPCPVVSAGSTPTARHARDLTGVTEMRPGVYTLMDLDQMSIGACGRDDIAVSVLATVVGHNRQARKVLIDAGALALSKDRSAANHQPEIGYGLVCISGSTEPLPGVSVGALSQEHGHVTAVDGGDPPYDALPIGSQVRVLPNHACITAAAYDHYNVLDGAGAITDRWDRTGGW